MCSLAVPGEVPAGAGDLGPPNDKTTVTDGVNDVTNYLSNSRLQCSYYCNTDQAR